MNVLYIGRDIDVYEEMQLAIEDKYAENGIDFIIASNTKLALRELNKRQINLIVLDDKAEEDFFNEYDKEIFSMPIILLLEKQQEVNLSNGNSITIIKTGKFIINTIDNIMNFCRFSRFTEDIHVAEKIYVDIKINIDDCAGRYKIYDGNSLCVGEQIIVDELEYSNLLKKSTAFFQKKQYRNWHDELHCIGKDIANIIFDNQAQIVHDTIKSHNIAIDDKNIIFYLSVDHNFYPLLLESMNLGKDTEQIPSGIEDGIHSKRNIQNTIILNHPVIRTLQQKDDTLLHDTYHKSIKERLSNKAISCLIIDITNTNQNTKNGLINIPETLLNNTKTSIFKASSDFFQELEYFLTTNKESFDIVHFRGRIHTSSDSHHINQIVVPDSTGELAPVSFSKLATMLCDYTTTVLLYLADYSGASSNVINETIKKTRIPMVVGYRRNPRHPFDSNEAAQKSQNDNACFTETFYQFLLEEKIPVEEAFRETRKWYFEKNPNDPIWAGGILMMQDFDPEDHSTLLGENNTESISA